ncbi:MAG TPA: ATP-binding protein, partial [Prosthecobacter sp.]|nr:ATP-binding protein [Prosthecobacter sp.]
LDTFQQIVLKGEAIGAVYVAADFQAINDRLRNSALIMFLVMWGALTVAFLLSRAFGRVVSLPILHLAGVAGVVATGKDYSVRAVKDRNDELGRLIDAFNEMLEQIQLQDSALQAAREQLEHRVRERTSELAESVSLLNATLDSTADGILAVEFDGSISCCNSKFLEMWGLSPELMPSAGRGQLLKSVAEQTNDPEAFRRKVVEGDEGANGEVFDVINLRDGRAIERYVKPQVVEGKRAGSVMSFRDITARRMAEAQLAEASERLITTSRQAGMAEVATSVLHNVGNVLNSVSVSAEVVASKARNLRIAGLTKVAEMLAENENDIAGFFARNPKAKGLPNYLLLLAQNLEQPQKGILQEIDLLKKNIEHIKEIVAMQQTYARGCGVLERLKVSELIDDAIRINEAGFTRHELTLEKDLLDDPEIVTDRHKVLQILVNLLSNAKYAVSEIRGKKVVAVKARKSDADRLVISVADNGGGIAAENLTRIFQHGFTTKKNGHGFGLHSGALAARELGGSLTPYSEGLGKGATFELELPIREQMN